MRFQGTHDVTYRTMAIVLNTEHLAEKCQIGDCKTRSRSMRQVLRETSRRTSKCSSVGGLTVGTPYQTGRRLRHRPARAFIIPHNIPIQAQDAASFFDRFASKWVPMADKMPHMLNIRVKAC